MENEKSARELSREIVSDFVTVEKRTFVDGKMSDYEVPYGRIGFTKICRLVVKFI